MSATRIFSRFKELLDVSWGNISDGEVLKRSGSDIVGEIIPAGAQGPPGPQGVAQIWRGVYNPATTYQVNDAVEYGGSSFVATQVTTGVTPIPTAPPLLPPLANTTNRGSIAALPASNQANYYARGDNTWQILPATTYVVGPASSVVDEIANYADTTGKLLGRVTRAAAVPVGGVVQTKFVAITSANVSATIPVGVSTIPQITQGTQIGSLSITPIFSNSLVRVTVMGAFTINPADWASAALFRGAAADSVAWQQVYTATNGASLTIAIDKFDSPGTTSAITYTLRIGKNTAGGTLQIYNGQGGHWTFAAQEIRQ